MVDEAAESGTLLFLPVQSPCGTGLTPGGERLLSVRERVFTPRVARTGDGVHRLQEVGLRHQAPEAERDAIQEGLCRAPDECASAGNRGNRDVEGAAAKTR